LFYFIVFFYTSFTYKLISAGLIAFIDWQQSKHLMHNNVNKTVLRITAPMMTFVTVSGNFVLLIVMTFPEVSSAGGDISTLLGRRFALNIWIFCHSTATAIAKIGPTSI
jgi:predicted PurR-regulated permease PerM